MRVVLLLALCACGAFARPGPDSVDKVTAILSPGSVPEPALDTDEGLAIFEARGSHQDSAGLRKCYDTIRRVAGCPTTTKQDSSGNYIVGTTSTPLVCRPADRDGSNIVAESYSLLRTMAKSSVVKNAYFTGPANGGKDKPRNQHFTDVFVGRAVYNILNAADQSAVAQLTGAAKTSYEALSQANQMWASVKFGFFSGKKERMAFGSSQFRTHLRNVRSSPVTLFGACRRVKFVLASMDVGADVAKYEHEKKATIAKIINKVVTTVVKIGVSASPIGGDAAGAIVATLADLVDSAIDSSKSRTERKYALQAILLDMFNGFVPPVEDTPPLEAMAAGNAAQSNEILTMLAAVQAKMGIAPPPKPQPKSQKPQTPPPPPQQQQQAPMAPKKPSTPPPPVPSGRSGKNIKFMSHRYRQRRNVDVDVALLEDVPEMYKPVKYDEGADCDSKVKALLFMIEKLFEDEPQVTKEVDNGIETPLYTEMNQCGPNPSIMGEKENVLRAKAMFKLIKYFVHVPDASDVEAESWLAGIFSKANAIIDKAGEGVALAIGGGEGGF